LRKGVSEEEVKGSKRLVGEALLNNPLTAINKKSCLLHVGKGESNHIEGGSKQGRQLNQNGWARADCLAALRALDQAPDLVTKFNVSRTPGAAAASSYSADAEDQRLTKMTGVSFRH